MASVLAESGTMKRKRPEAAAQLGVNNSTKPIILQVSSFPNAVFSWFANGYLRQLEMITMPPRLGSS